MPYTIVCRVIPDDGKIHDPYGKIPDRTVCGKRKGKMERSGTGGKFHEIKDACVECFPFAEKYQDNH